MCTATKGMGGQCSNDTDCTSGNCAGGQCGAVKTATPTATQTPKDPGAPCSTSSQCPDGYFCSTDERVCCTSESCPTGESCKVADSPGDCTIKPTVTPTPTPLPTAVPTGGPCTSPDVCDTGFCTDGVCCDSDTCLDPDRCDIFGTEGTCAPPLLEGDECEKNTDCEDPLICAFNPVSNRFECTAPPEPTPTLIPFTPVSTPLPPIVHTSRSGGCSIGGGADGSQAWVLCVLPFALWLRRRHLQRVRVRTDERGLHQ